MAWAVVAAGIPAFIKALLPEVFQAAARQLDRPPIRSPAGGRLPAGQPTEASVCQRNRCQPEADRCAGLRPELHTYQNSEQDHPSCDGPSPTGAPPPPAGSGRPPYGLQCAGLQARRELSYLRGCVEQPTYRLQPVQFRRAVSAFAQMSWELSRCTSNRATDCHGRRRQQEDRVDVEEVSRQDRMGLGGHERAPCLAAPIGCGVDAGVAEDLPYGRRRDFAAEAAAAVGKPGRPSA